MMEPGSLSEYTRGDALFHSDQSPKSRFSGRGGTVLLSLLLLALVGITYYPALNNGFVGFDDPDYVTANFHVQRGLTWSNLAWAFRTNTAGNWHPLTWLSHMLDCQIFGLAPWGHHLTSILFHAANTILLFLLLKRLTGATWGSFFVAAFFGLHPMHVESVAWIAERKDVLSTFFGLLTIGAYLRFAQVRRKEHGARSKELEELRKEEGARRKENGARSTEQGAREMSAPLFPSSFFLFPFSFFLFPFSRSLLLALLVFALSLMAKPMLVTLPFVLLLLDYWPLNLQFTNNDLRAGDHDLRTTPHASRFTPSLWRLIVEKVPFFLLSLAVCIVTLVVQKQSGFVSEAWPLGDRLENAVVSYCRYLGKWLWPTHLAVYYPHPDRWPPLIVAGACVVLLAMTALCLAQRKRRPWLPVGWFWFIGTLVPVIGLVQVGNQAMADRYSYIPSIGICLLLVWTARDLAVTARKINIGLACVGVVLIGCCIGLSRKQIGYWKDSVTLFRHAVAITRDNALAYDNLGTALSAEGKVGESIVEYRRALEIKPDFAEAHNNLGSSLLKLGKRAEAIRQFVQALRLKPDLADAHYNLGNALNEEGRLRDAAAEYAEALKFKPAFPAAHYNLGNMLNRLGQFDAAIVQYQQALKIDPGYIEAHYNLGLAFAHTGRLDDAIQQFRQFLKSRPDWPRAWITLAVLLGKTGRIPEAIHCYREAMRLVPADPETHFNLGLLLKQQGRRDEAIREFKETLRLKPGDAAAKRELEAVSRERKTPVEN